MKARIGIIAVAAALAAAPLSVSAQRVMVGLPADSVHVGEPFKLVLVATYPPAFDLLLPHATEDEPAMLGDFELRRLLERDVQRRFSGDTRDSIVFEAATFALDTARTAGASVDFLVEGDTVSTRIAHAEVLVASTYREGEPPRELAPIVDFPPDPWPWIFASAAFLAAVGLVIYLVRRRRRDAPDEAAPPLSAYEEARQRLGELEHRPAETPEQQKAFVVELTDVFRMYLSRRGGIPARERTSREILVDLEQQPVDALRVERAHHILSVSDRIKFAGQAATAAILHETRTDTLAWIEEMERTLQQPEAPRSIPEEQE